MTEIIEFSGGLKLEKSNLDAVEICILTHLKDVTDSRMQNVEVLEYILAGVKSRLRQVRLEL